jgi:transcriptional regulator with XRE-family HTH domain
MKKMKLHTYLKRRRAQLGLTLRDMEKKTQGRLSNGHISQLENGIMTTPKVQTLVLLSMVLKTDYVAMLKMAGYLK